MTKKCSQCNREAVVKCPHCGDYFCADHIKPKSPSLPHFDNYKKNMEWKDSEHTHPCAPYYDYQLKKDKEQHLKCQRSLDRMNVISKGDVTYALTIDTSVIGC